MFRLFAFLILFPGMLLRSGSADPCMVYDGGRYYLTMTGTRNIAVIASDDVEGLSADNHPLRSDDLVYRSAEDATVRALFGEDAEINGTWSPEIHYISDSDCPGEAGWYMFFAIRAKHLVQGKPASDRIKMVVLKSSSGNPGGPYANPATGDAGQSQPILDKDGRPLSRWAIGFSLLKIPSGRHAGLYGMWVEEEGRGEGYGRFFQKIMIARMKSPWQLAGDPSEITRPTQDWEKAGATSRLPMVVEGATAVYGDHGEVFLAYCGSGYWADYGLGQMTLLRDGDDFADPCVASSWIKFKGNPVFSSAGDPDVRGAGHAFFFRDASGKRAACYHAYPVVDGVKGKRRNAYLIPYTIDSSAACPSAPYGVLRF